MELVKTCNTRCFTLTLSPLELRTIQKALLSASLRAESYGNVRDVETYDRMSYRLDGLLREMAFAESSRLIEEFYK